MGLKVILTGATGMVGEGVLIELLQNSQIDSVLVVGRRACGLTHPKLKELLTSDFFALSESNKELAGFDACFYCAGISSNGLNEEVYTKITYDTTMHLAAILKSLNPQIVFNFVSGGHTDSSEQGRVMWARVKGRTENALQKMFPGREYNFRPGLMKPFPQQKHIYGYNKLVVMLPFLRLIFPMITLQQLAQAMIATTLRGYPKPILEVKDIVHASKSA
ncbi:NAD-dependent epimerase/dehydratase family protein [Bdellovibrio sp. NC01]|uniref:NAD-dependent epimerase/dehydratase family protein n=1 Tax=Bdellovibrio sp. NC01 TaxID=2220073 RepID=UPI001157160A|nr:NAD-dependent epimerase/dehydratase family protein [Bdellovibrio sp. NC01]QDK38623.1 epimerase [Bdellovibrio sp. NC01]